MPMMYRIPGDPVAILTTEGKAAVLEAINDLKNADSKRPALVRPPLSAPLTACTRAHVCCRCTAHRKRCRSRAV
jgi:hypothetical protein